MLPYSFRLALRHFSRKRIYSSIIILSLTVGFVCTCLLVSFLIAEENVDSFHAKRERLFELVSDDPFGASEGRLNYTTVATGNYLASYPEVENSCQLTAINHAEAEIDEKATPLATIGVDTSFFTMFDFPLASGTRKLTSDGVFITSAKARQLFGTTNVLGESFSLRTRDSVRLVSITGVFAEPKEKSHLKFDAVVSHAVIERPQGEARGGVHYLLLHNPDASTLEAKINGDTLRPTLLGTGKLKYYFVPLEKAYTSLWNRYPYMQTRSETFIWVGWIVGGLILFMASFNFANLFLLSMQERKKEAGIQKTLGISFWQVLRGATTEAGIYIGISFSLAIILAYSLMPIFNSVLQVDLQFDYMSRVTVLLIIGGVVLFLAIVVVLAATLQQRRVLPVSMMRNVSAKVRFSKLFFTLQFFVSITLCVCSITIIKQMKFIETAPIGFNRNIIQLDVIKKDLAPKVTELKNLVLQIPGVDGASQSSGNPISGLMIVAVEIDGKPVSVYLFEGDDDLVTTLDLEVLEGAGTIKNPGDKIVNETYLKTFNVKNPIGADFPGGPQGSKIVGVVKDFTCSSFKAAIPAVAISHRDQARSLLISYGQSDPGTLLPKIQASWTKIFPDEPFEFKILQQDLMKKYSEESLFYKVVLAASITSMIISCFGLFALSWAVIKSRAKEMGIRKVLGASIANVLGLLTATFAKRLLLAFAFAAPTGYYLMTLWMDRFVSKAPIDAWVFGGTALALTFIAIITLGFQTLKASLSSPLDEIKE
ncbi:MAG: FtsX-like permease family protein [Bacteroidota bacterium]